MQETYNVGIYARLSRDDERAGESVSIENQKELLTRYVREQGWNLYDYYCDDGVSGTTFDRPSFNRLVQDATDKKIMMKVKGNAGEHLTTNPPYGYMKSPDNPKLWIKDEEAAQVVYEIGLYVMDGFGPSQIARKLRERKILAPSAYFESKAIKYPAKKQGDPCGWDASTIADMMDRWREYLGHTVNFKTRKKSYKSKKTILNPESEWAIFENTHESIWTEAMADDAQQRWVKWECSLA